MKKIVVKDQKKFKKFKRSVVKFSSLCVIIATVSFGATVKQKYEVPTPDQVVKVYIEQGDTLYSIAKKYYNDEMNFQNYIYYIEKFNELDSCNIVAGDVLEIPVYKK